MTTTSRFQAKKIKFYMQQVKSNWALEYQTKNNIKSISSLELSSALKL